ncbi:MAG: alanine--tRNA ligase [Thermodesulfobacteriota bacterium]|nr:alanine--tRNA ligase [Thermodesulfobacteriota bacterium]
MITAAEIRQRFLDYFAENGHAVVESSPLIPKDDPSLLFTNAGMVQFKNTFLGREKRSYTRAASSQKCLRVGGKHNDLENVGRTGRHHTFFEMLGNFSFGDYFKADAIRFAWEFLTKDLGLPKEKLYATVFNEDDEAEQLWKDVANIPADRIFRLGEKDNFWSMGETGPCGPCSEVLFDQGEHVACGPDCGIGKCDCDRYLEVWNLVFMQYDQIDPNTRIDLPKPSIDTGMGLERVAAVCQGVYTNFDTDLFSGVIEFTADLAKTKYGQNLDFDTALRVIADHSRAVAFMIADGILPANDGRGYVLRRLIRRAFRFGRLLGLRDPFLYRTALEVVAQMGAAYPELKQNQDFMTRVVLEEEERFSHTLDKGLLLLEEEMENIKPHGTVPGKVAFKLYDTFGFPLDIVNDVAEKKGLTVDEKGFEKLMAKQKERAKAAWKGSGETDLADRFKALLEEGLRSEFVGYESLCAKGRIAALLGPKAEPAERLAKGESGFVVVSKTPFYGESGGQTGDTGTISTPTGACAVAEAIKPAPELTVHRVTVTQGEILTDQEADMTVDKEKRMATARNHTATHLLHAALRKVLGEHVKQSGSLVGPERLRFDFTHIKALTPDEIAEIESEVNRAVLADIPLHTEVVKYEDALDKGAMALFGEKYSALVRVVEIPGASVELCGGTHLSATGQTGLFCILSESGIAAGMRRIEAATGWNAINLFTSQRRELETIAGLVKGNHGETAAKVKGLQSELKGLKKDMEKLAARAAGGKGKDLMDSVQEIGGVKVLAARVEAPNMGALRKLMDDVRSKMPSGVACLGAAGQDKAMILLYVSKDLHQRFTAPKLIKEVAVEVGGSGGGRPDLAQAGGSNPKGMDKAFAKLRELVDG